jgi:hypothetical protein
VPGPTVDAQLYAGADDVLAFAGPNCDADQAPAAATTWWLYLVAMDPRRLPDIRREDLS